MPHRIASGAGMPSSTANLVITIVSEQILQQRASRRRLRERIGVGSDDRACQQRSFRRLGRQRDTALDDAVALGHLEQTGVHDRRQQFVLDLDQLDGFFGDMDVVGGHRGDRVAFVQNLVASQHIRG